jgi:hypothetical protein
MADGEGEDEAALAERVREMGRAGFCRVEIAAGLELTLAQLAAREAGSPGLAAALALAEEAAKAWWAAVSRQAWAQGARFNTAAWREAVRWRFGEDEAAGAPAPAPRHFLADFDLPCNGRGGTLPNGQCRDCGKVHRGRRR